MSPPNYYEILQVSPDASAADIKRAYRALSLEWHPDRNASPEAHSKIQAINEAYSILCDDQQRAMYDMELQFGENPGMRSGEDMEDINHLLNMMFGSLSRATPGFFAGGTAGPHIHVFSAGPPPHHHHHHSQTPYPFPFPSQQQQQPHHSYPGMNPFAFFNGINMGGGGPGPMMFAQQHPPSQQHSTSHPLQSQQEQKETTFPPPCEPIVKHVSITFQQAYTGAILPVEVEMWTYNADTDMKISQWQTIEVPIPAGVDDEELIVLPKMGHCRENNGVLVDRGDIKIVVKCEPSPVYERQGMNLTYKKTITLKESLCGFSFEVMHPSGKQLMLNNLTNRTIIRPGYKKIISNLGMVREGNSGNLTVEFQVVFPEVLTPEQMDQLSAIL